MGSILIRKRLAGGDREHGAKEIRDRYGDQHENDREERQGDLLDLEGVPPGAG